MAFKMKGHTLPGIKQKSEGNTDLKDGRSGSAAFQQKSPLEQITKEEAKKKALEELNRIHAAQWDAEERGDQMLVEILHAKGREKLEEGRELYGSKNTPKYKSAFQHRVDDVPSHQESYPDHSDDLETEKEHQEAHDRLYWPNGKKRTEREIFEYDETKAEEEKEKEKDKKRPQGVDPKWENADEVD
jgi:hypothetical protein